MKKIFALLMCVCLLALSVSAAETTADTTLLGQVTAISGNNVTLAIGTQNQPDASGGTPPAAPSESDADKPEAPPQDSSSVPSGDTSESSSGGSAQPPSGGPGGGHGGLTLTGEEKTVTIADGADITIESMGSSSTGALSDIAVGDILSVTLSSDTVTAVTIRRMGGGKQPTAGSSAKTAALTSSSVHVNGSSVAFEAYNIDGSNYFKLRDLAQVLNGTAKQFQVGYDSTNKAITLTSGESYTAVGGELTATTNTGSVEAALSSSSIYLDGTKINLTAYTIGGNNYFKLRDAAEALDFGVTWDSSTSTIGIDTTTGYTAE